MAKVNLKINNIAVSAEEGSTILEAARLANIRIPTLCYLKETNEIGACRICLVELKNRPALVPACVFPVSEGMEVLTGTKRVLESRKKTLELILSDHDKKCTSCVRSGECELQKLAHEFGCEEDKFKGEENKFKKDESTPFIVRDNNKCILCRRCEAVCSKVQQVGVIGASGRGFSTRIACAFDRDLNDVPCVACGQCILVCPTGALREKDDTDRVIAALNDPELHVVVGTAPSVRAGLGEEFGYPIGTDVEGKMVSSLKALGFDQVFDVDITADLTIMEEGTEFLSRLQNKGTLPMITSCSPGWIRFIEFNYPELLGHLSTCKSPQQMFGAVVKTYYAQKNNIDPKKIFVVSAMPCTAKKFEITRPYMDAAGVPDVDAVITSRELARMIKRSGIDFAKLPDSKFDSPLGISSGAGVIFGASGGVMEAALRTVNDLVTGKDNKDFEFKEIRGTKGIREKVYNIGGTEVKVCVSTGIGNADKVLKKIKSGKADWHFVEIMTCPGGCVNGGGQPQHPSSVLNTTDLKKLRAKTLYSNDKKNVFRKSHHNPVVKELYDNFFDAPNSHKAHEVLHTKYVKRDKY